MKIPHPIKKIKNSEAEIKKQARQTLDNYQPEEHQSPVSNKIIWYLVGGFIFLFILKGLSILIGG